MIIADNILAMNAERQFKIVNNRKKQSMEKLSSGYRINRASDDAAGLSISEKMRSQIRGLTQGTRNIEDGISLCQVADGALEEVSSMLQRIRQLSVQSANDTNTPEDREAIQKEIDQILLEIDRISESTEFNTKKIFCGTDQQLRQRKIGRDTQYREEVRTRQVQVAHTESFAFNVSGQSSESEAGTYTIGQSTSADSGIVIGSDVITWDRVKHQDGSAVDPGSEIKSGRYSFDYKGMTVSFNIDNNLSVEDFLSGLKGMKWSSRQKYEGKMNYTFTAESEGKRSSDPVNFIIEAKEDGLWVRGTRYDWPSIVNGTGSNASQSFTVQAEYLKLTLSTGSDNTVPYEDIFNNIGTKSITETSTYWYRTTIRNGQFNDDNGNDNHSLLKGYYTANEINAMMSSYAKTWADEGGMWIEFGNWTTGKKTWDELYATSTLTPLGDTHLVYEFGEDKLEFDVVSQTSREELILGMNNNQIRLFNKAYVYNNVISNTLADVYTEGGDFATLYLDNKLTADEYDKARIVDQFSFTSIGDGTPAKVIDPRRVIRWNEEKPTNMTDPTKEPTSTNGFSKSTRGNLLNIKGYGASAIGYELVNKEELIEYFNNRTVTGGGSGGSSINLYFTDGNCRISLKMTDTLETACDLDTFLDAITARASYYNENLIAPVFTQTGADVDYRVKLSFVGTASVNELITQYSGTVDSANKNLYTYWADSVVNTPTYSWEETKDEQYVIRIPIDESGEDIVDEETYLDDEYLGLWIQCAANTAQGFMLEIDAMSTAILGIDDFDVSTREGADVGITMADYAIYKVLRNRSKIGVQQNRLEHAYDGERNTTENLQSSESRIRDANISKEAMILAKQRIIEEAGLAMITHANQDKQGVLTLLR